MVTYTSAAMLSIAKVAVKLHKVTLLNAYAVYNCLLHLLYSTLCSFGTNFSYQLQQLQVSYKATFGLFAAINLVEHYLILIFFLYPNHLSIQSNFNSSPQVYAALLGIAWPHFSILNACKIVQNINNYNRDE